MPGNFKSFEANIRFTPFSYKKKYGLLLFRQSSILQPDIDIQNGLLKIWL